MNHQTIEAFVQAFADTPRLAELEIRSPDMGTLRLRRNPSPAKPAKPEPRPQAKTAVVTPAPTVDTPAESAFVVTGTIIESSLVGVFRAATKTTVGVGSSVSQGQPLGAVEVMRLSSDVPAPVSGEIVTIFVQDGEPVEYGQPLFEIARTRQRKQKMRNKHGFGLIETLIVIVIIAVLALILIPRLTGAGKTPEEKRRTPIGAAKNTAGIEYIGQINQAVMMYKQDNDDALPPSLQALKPYGVTDEMMLDPVTKQPLAYNPQTGAVGVAATQAPGAVPAPGGVPPRQNVGPGGVSLPTIPQTPIDAGGGE